MNLNESINQSSTQYGTQVSVPGTVRMNQSISRSIINLEFQITHATCNMQLKDIIKEKAFLITQSSASSLSGAVGTIAV